MRHHCNSRHYSTFFNYRGSQPILQSLHNFEWKDAILDLTDPANPAEPDWPDSDFIVGNPPFLGGNKIRKELGDDCVNALFKLYAERVHATSDLCCYWFERARSQVERVKCQRAGLLATQAIRGGANREVLNRIKRTSDLFFAVSDQNWVIAGANVHISLIGFDDGSEKCHHLDRHLVERINSDLTTDCDVTSSKRLAANLNLWCYGSQQKAKFDIPPSLALKMLGAPNPSGLPNSDVIKPSMNGKQILRDTHETFVIDFGEETLIDIVASYEKPFEYVKKTIYPRRKNHREACQRLSWWLHARPSPRYRKAIREQVRCIITPAVSKHRIFMWIEPPALADHALIVFLRSDDYFFGVLHSKLHEVWSRAQGTQVRERESGFRYTPKACFETFPFPEPTDGQKTAIANAARRL